jgi:hypothetical protein
MAEPTTPLPADVVDRTADERPMLEAFLRYFRVVLARKAEGITDEQARRAACPPSDMTLLGLVRHMGEVERIWAQWIFSGEQNAPIFYGRAHPSGDEDGDFHPPADATLAEAFEVYWAQIAAADAVYAAADLDQVAATEGRSESLRWIYVHLIEEYARHCGHADLLREAVDGVTGD